MLKLIITTLFVVTSFIAQADEGIMSAITPSVAASNFTLDTPEGQPLSLNDFSGKYVLVNFWAHWCSPCIKEFPDMQQLYDHVDKEQFEIIGIHAGPYGQEAADFVRYFDIKFHIVSDPETSLKGWDIPALPMTYLINPEGKIIYKAVGPRTWNVKDIEKLISTSINLEQEK